MNTPEPSEEILQKLEQLRQRLNEELTPSQRLLMLELIEKEMDKLNAEMDKLLAEVPR